MAYDGSAKWDRIELGLRRDGYAQEFACAYFDDVPKDLGWTGRESGWELRRKLKAWCAAKGITDFKILRNTSYHPDLHGSRVYELWTRAAPAARPPQEP